MTILKLFVARFDSNEKLGIVFKFMANLFAK